MRARDKACVPYVYQPIWFYDLDTILILSIGSDGYTVSMRVAFWWRTDNHPQLKVVEHCANIGLRPTIITHGQTEKKVKEIEDAGLDDWPMTSWLERKSRCSGC